MTTTTRTTKTAAEQGAHDAELRAFEALATTDDGAEWQSEADAVVGWGEYASTAASFLDVPRADRDRWIAEYQAAAETTARDLYLASVV